MATTKKTGIVEKVKSAISGFFSSDAPARKSPEHAAAGQKAAVTTSAKKAVTATAKSTRSATKKAAKAARPAAKRKAKR